MILGIQIVAILFGLFMVYVTYIRRKKDEFTFKEGLVWILIWVAFMILSFFPRMITSISKDVFDLTRPLDLYIILGFMFMIGVNFYTYSVLRKTQKKIDNVVRKIAISKAYDPSKTINKSKHIKK